jgi:aspartate/methionine/tyrosine aminotransferase
MAVVQRGDEVLSFTPGYPLPQKVVTAMGGVLRQVVLNSPMQRGDRWTFDESAVRKAFGGRTRCLVVASPHNPTGKVFTQIEFGTLIDLCAAHRALLIVDAVYEDFLYPPALSVSARALDPQHVALVGSVSKNLRAPGLRVGWVVAPQAVASTAAHIVDSLSAGVCLPAQYAAAAALSVLPHTYWTEQRDAAQAKCQRLTAALDRLEFECLVPEGGLALLATSAQRSIKTDEDLTAALSRIGLGGVPMCAFGRAQPEGRSPLVRLAFGRPNDIFERVDAIVAHALTSRPAPFRRV